MFWVYNYVHSSLGRALRSRLRRPAVCVSIPVSSRPSSSLLAWRVLRLQRAVDRKIFLTMVWSLETLINGGMEPERLTYTLNLLLFICISVWMIANLQEFLCHHVLCATYCLKSLRQKTTRAFKTELDVLSGKWHFRRLEIWGNYGLN